MAKSTFYITNEKGKKISVVLSVKEYRKMVDKVEELEDIKAYESARKKELTFIDAEEAFKKIEQKRKQVHV